MARSCGWRSIFNAFPTDATSRWCSTGLVTLVDRAAFKGADHIGYRIGRRHHDRRNIGIPIAGLRQEIEPRGVGQVEIEEHQIGPARGENLQKFLAARNDTDAIALTLEDRLNEPARHRIVFDVENLGRRFFTGFIHGA